MQPLKRVLLATVACVLAVPAFADTYNAVTDYIPGANPNGAWSYGYIDGTGFHLATVHLVNQIFEFYPPNIDGWTDDHAPTPYTDFYTPVVALNLGAPATAGSHDLRNDMVLMHPGVDGQEAAVRWTAQTTGFYDLATLFTGLNGEGTTVDTHIMLNGADVYSGWVMGYMATDNYATNAAYITAGDTVTMAVGGAGSFGLDTTGLQAVIATSAVPEPVSGVLFGTLLLATGAIARFRKRR
jgi:hypothetical protein